MVSHSFTFVNVTSSIHPRMLKECSHPQSIKNPSSSNQLPPSLRPQGRPVSGHGDKDQPRARRDLASADHLAPAKAKFPEPIGLLLAQKRSTFRAGAHRCAQGCFLGCSNPRKRAITFCRYGKATRFHQVEGRCAHAKDQPSVGRCFPSPNYSVTCGQHMSGGLGPICFKQIGMHQYKLDNR